MTKIIKSAEEINNEIKESFTDKKNKRIVRKSLSLEKAIASIEQKIKEILKRTKEMTKDELLFLEKNGITIIFESDLPLTTKTEKELENIYNEKGYYFSYNVNAEKEKYYLCVGTLK